MSSNSAIPTITDSEILFTLLRNEVSSNINPPPPHNNEMEIPTSTADEFAQSDSIMCVIWKANKIGAAYYKMNDRQLYFLQETVDLPPKYVATQLLYHEVNPFHTITVGKQCDLYVKFLINLDNKAEDNSDLDSMQNTNVPAHLSLLNMKQYTYEACEQIVLNLDLPNATSESITQAQREVALHSLIDFDSKLSVHALGSLIKYIENNWVYLNQNINQDLKFLNVKQISLSDRVFIDRNCFKGLHIFEVDSHESKFLYGRQYSNREGGIYKLMAQHCRTKLGCQYLKYMLRSPTTNMEELNKRFDFIEFAMRPTNQNLIESLQESTKNISDLQNVLGKIRHSRAQSRDWEILHKTLYNLLFLNEICGPYHSSSQLLAELNLVIPNELYHLQGAINSAIEFAPKFKRGRPIIKFGLDRELDAKQLKKQDIVKSVTAAARFAVNQLPDFVNECSVIHIPEMGHLVAIRAWEPNCDKYKLKDFGFQFVFEINGTLHYKNAMCLELNKQLGNIHDDILAHENRIIQRLAGYVSNYTRYLNDPLKIIALIDCLISVSYVSKEKGYVRPELNNNSVYEIEGGRYPLLEFHTPDFVSNDYFSGGNHGRIKIITGPNDSGKSVYLKQVTLIIFLAHVGLFVPAKRANIGIVNSIHCRIHATESAGVSLSAFMLDLSQMSQALHYSKRKSLVILDEFGRGTTGDDGTALLVGALSKFRSEGENSPHVMVSTHLQQIGHYLPESDLIKYLKMDHTRCESGNIVFLYKVVPGISNSFAFEVAACAGLDGDLIERAKDFYAGLYHNAFLDSENNMMQIDNRNNINIPDPDD